MGFISEIFALDETVRDRHKLTDEEFCFYQSATVTEMALRNSLKTIEKHNGDKDSQEHKDFMQMHDAIRANHEQAIAMLPPKVLKAFNDWKEGYVKLCEKHFGGALC